MASPEHVGQQFADRLQRAKEAWLGDVSMEIAGEAARETGAPKWSTAGRSDPVLREHARDLLHAAAQDPLSHPVFHGVSASHNWKPGDIQHVPLRATSRSRDYAESFAMPDLYPEEHTIYEYHNARGTKIHDDEHVITGRYKVRSSTPHHVVLDYHGPMT